MLDNLRTLFRYNSRILLANSYWLLIIPLVASQLVIFWHMAVAALVTPATVVKTFELTIPLLGAFMCAHIVAPEHRNRVDELTFVRPVPFTRTIAMRALALFAILAILAVVMLYVYKAGLKQQIDLTTVLVAGIPSTLFLSMLGLAFASSWRSPAAGIGAALVYWAADAWRGADFNPLFTLYSYSVHLRGQAEDATAPTSDWLTSKVVLLALALVLAVATMKGLQRPASPKRWRSLVRLGAGSLALAIVYVCSGAYIQLQAATEEAMQSPRNARAVFAGAMRPYGYIPVAYQFGPAFARYVGYPPARISAFDEYHEGRESTIQRLRDVAESWPESPWADNALYEVVRLTPTEEPDTEEGRRSFRVVLKLSEDFLARYPTSEFAPWVAARMVAMGRGIGDEEVMMWAYDRVTKVYAGTEASAEAAGELQSWYLQSGQVDKAIQAARMAAEAAPPETRADALLSFAEFLLSQGRGEQAREIFVQTESAVQAQLEALGLAQITADSFSPEKMQQRGEIIRLRARARDGIAALDSPAPPPAEETAAP